MQVTAASRPPKWIARWAGVQNVSRPMVMCQEISQYKPKVMEVTAVAPDQTCQGTAAARIAIPAGSVWEVISSGILWAISAAQLCQEQKIAAVVRTPGVLGSMPIHAVRVVPAADSRTPVPSLARCLRQKPAGARPKIRPFFLWVLPSGSDPIRVAPVSLDLLLPGRAASLVRTRAHSRGPRIPIPARPALRGSAGPCPEPDRAAA